MSRTWRMIEAVCEVLGLLALASLVALPFTQVILRDFFSSPIVGLEEATRWGLIGLVFLSVPLLISRNEQIRFSEFIDALPLRPRVLLERAILLLAGAAFATLVWAGTGSILKNSSTRTPTLDIPFWLFASPFLAGISLAAIGCFYFALRRKSPPTAVGAPHN